VLVLIALDRDARCVDETERLVGDSGHACDAIDGVVPADFGHMCKVHGPGFGRCDCQSPSRSRENETKGGLKGLQTKYTHQRL